MKRGGVHAGNYVLHIAREYGSKEGLRALCGRREVNFFGHIEEVHKAAKYNSEASCRACLAKWRNPKHPKGGKR